MSYKSMNVHKKTYEIDGKFYTVIADFNKDRLWIEHNGRKTEYSVDEYANFTGNMKSFVTSKITGKTHE
jgi:hypothetical protein